MRKLDALSLFAVENTALQAYWTDEDGNFIGANPAACEALGYRLDELLTLTLPEVDPTVDLAAWRDILAYLIVHKKTVIETVHRRKDGSVFDAEVTVSLFEQDGKKVVVGLAQDISQRKKLETALSKTNATFLAAINTTSLGFWVLDVNGRFMEVNEAYLKASGYTKAELLGMRISDLDAIDTEADTQRRIAAVMSSGGDRFRSRHRRKDGSEWSVEIVASYAGLDGGRFFVFVEDITDKVAAETAQRSYRKELERHEELLANAQRIANLGNWSLDVVRDELYWSSQIYELFGVDPRSFKPTYEGFLSCVHPEDRTMVDTSYRQSLADKTPYDMEHRIVRAPGNETRWVHERCEHIVDDDGAIVRSDGTIQDITDRKLMEQYLTESIRRAEEANKSKSEFLANMSHDLRTPLNAILGFSEMMFLETMGSLPGIYKEYAGLIERSGKVLLNAVNSILDLAKIEAGKFELELEDTNIKGLVDEVIAIHKVLADRKNLTLENKTHDMHVLKIDRVRFSQVLSNIIGNAIKFTDRGGVVIENHCEGTSHRIIVTDTGPGMTTEQIAIAMQPFGQVHGHAMARRNAGTGLGLSISERIMHLHGGALTMESTVGKGTSVVLSFPGKGDDAKA